jgi:hypothetical protein
MAALSPEHHAAGRRRGVKGGLNRVGAMFPRRVGSVPVTLND